MGEGGGWPVQGRKVRTKFGTLSSWGSGPWGRAFHLTA